MLDRQRPGVADKPRNLDRREVLRKDQRVNVEAGRIVRPRTRMIRRMVCARDRLLRAQRLGNRRTQEVRLVRIGGGHQQIAVRHPRLAQDAGVARGALKRAHVHRLLDDRELLGRPVNDDDVVAGGDQDLRRVPTHLAGADNDDVHGPAPGGVMILRSPPAWNPCFSTD